MNSLIETLNQFGGQFLHFAWPMLWQSSLLIGFVLALDFLLARKIRASVRYALWLAVLVKLLLPPTLALPTGAAWWLFHAPPVVKAPAIRNYTVTYDTTPQTPFIPSTITLPPPPPPQLNGAGWALIATGVISVGLLLWLALRWWQVARMVRGATVSAGLTDLMEEVQRQAGLRSRLRLKLIEGRMSPAVCGLFRPVILLPRTLAEQLSPTQLRAVLLHEAFHLRRKDVWVNCAQALLQIIYWWHPLLWIANARIRRIREEAVDDAVMLALRDEADSYAPTLLEVAKLAFRRPLMSLGLVGIMESRSALRQRIERLVDFRAPRKAGLTLASLCGICVFSAVALPMGEAPATVESPSSSDSIKAESQPQRAMTFKLNHPEGEDVLKGQLLEAGVKIPPTIIHDFNNGRFFARGTTEQLVLIQQTVLKLNGYSPQEAASDTNIPDYAIKIPVDEPATPQFYSRTFGVSKDAVYANLLKPAGAQSNVVNSTAVSAAFRKLFAELGLNLESPPGKSIFYNEKLGKLFAKTTASDLDVIELAVMALNQPSAQNAGGYSPPVEATNVVGITGAFADSNSLAAARAAKQQSGVETLPEPVVTTTSGRGINRTATTNMYAPLSQTNFDQLLQDGKLLYEMGKLDEALVKFARAHLADPSSADAERYIILITGQHTNNSGKSYSGRQEIIAQLHSIRLKQVAFESTSLSNILRYLSQQSKQSDSQKKGINFYLSADPDTGQPGRMASSLITIDPPLTNMPLGDVLDAVVRGASEPIYYSVQDFTVSFWPGKPSQPLEPRIFKVDTNVFPAALLQQAAQSGFVLPDDAVNRVGLAFRHLSTAAGVNWYAPGKRVVYNAQRGWMDVTATAEDLRVLRQLVAELNKNKPAQQRRVDAPTPQIHIKARFIEVPAGVMRPSISWTNSVAGNFVGKNIAGILPNASARIDFQTLEKREGVMMLAEPEVTTTSGRQTQVRATQTVTILTNFVFEEFPTNHDGNVGTSSVTAKTDPIETGPIFDVVPKVLSDGYTLDLQMTASSMEFYGYADIPTNLPPPTVTTSTGETVVLPRVWPAVLRYQKSSHVNLFDGQTVILSLTNPEQVRFGEPDEKREAMVAKHIRDTAWHNGGRNDILVFVTVTIVDPEGNRVHSDDDLRFANDKIPPQPVQ